MGSSFSRHPDYYTALDQPIQLTAVVSFASDGTPTLQQWQPNAFGTTAAYSAAPTALASGGFGGPGTQGIAGFARFPAGGAHGDFAITLQQPVQRLLGVQATFTMTAGQEATNKGVSGLPAPICYVRTDGTNVGQTANSVTGPVIELVTYATTSGAATAFPLGLIDPISCTGIFTILLDNSGGT